MINEETTENIEIYVKGLPEEKREKDSIYVLYQELKKVSDIICKEREESIQLRNDRYRKKEEMSLLKENNEALMSAIKTIDYFRKQVDDY